MNLHCLYQGSFGKFSQNPSTTLPAKSLLLGDTPSVTAEGRLRVPLIGLPAILPRSVALLTPPAERYPPDTALDVVYDAAARGEFPYVSLTPREGNFALESMVLPDGKYDCWVITVE